MPELPEVETSRRGISPHIINKQAIDVVLRHTQLRWKIPQNLLSYIENKLLLSIDRRAKYLLFNFTTGTLLIHLGMSGSLRICALKTPANKHDHVDIVFSDCLLRFTDPRRFGAILWLGLSPESSTLLNQLGPEPLADDFTASYLYLSADNRKRPVKQFIMDQKVVTGVGNIYATEALFMAGIKPTRAAGNISLKRYQLLVNAIKLILQQAIQQGGTTLKDFVGGDGKPGYFQQTLQVYGKTGQKCPHCQTALKALKLAARNSVYCPKCQR
ncbi:bifunctional DNA-formamidopyrimidine glycosylase/DNA-(apurinic or apyrimidinic site) lyase [Psychromonas antarctica]|jgi:formamidopyrimidine-DNA glycosylase|uniref:bifunctional DNA-formamidopyrimidine glycosylase/DNA-(apurinic or apyrimidinic site) lyase n=1 Tax=Psychromonas antarctica TaxID=67573 RepID=UPI001EE8F3D1|nr:bifunctional DNA-formamidopyrimidine glycosylase/DNA-(apurinic or apyrimidinic site) lyase [Psychromonas antarctica]MCG6201471.1 bifunctional DNA-formamidopyrimidine glycosylase/DNA-(apurinic or apyrimidinic site) lyase [Psychromonas antarctica]